MVLWSILLFAVILSSIYVVYFLFHKRGTEKCNDLPNTEESMTDKITTRIWALQAYY